MDKYQNNTLVEEMDAIILLNDNYADKGLFEGYIGIVMANFIEKYGFVVADFSNPIEPGYIQPVIEIKKDDFRVISGSVADQKLVKAFKDLFRNKYPLGSSQSCIGVYTLNRGEFLRENTKKF